MLKLLTVMEFVLKLMGNISQLTQLQSILKLLLNSLYVMWKVLLVANPWIITLLCIFPQLYGAF